MSVSTDSLSRLPSWLHDLLDSCPTAGDGVHLWIFRVARNLLAHFDERSVYEIIRAKAANCGRPIRGLEREISVQIKGAFPCRWQPRNPGAFARSAQVPISHFSRPAPASLSIPRPKPKPDFEAIRRIASGDILLVDLVEQSPIRFDDERSHADEIIDVLFPSDPSFELLLCVGKSKDLFATRRREIWRGHLHRLPLIVPNPMLDYYGRTAAGHQSQHSKDNTAGRVYLVIEFDFSEFGRDGKTLSVWAPLVREWRTRDISVADACAALHLHLAEWMPLVCVTHSGGKSLHGWYYVFGQRDAELQPLMNYAGSLGADHATWTRSQFVRIPDGLRLENSKRQRCYYLDPGKAVKL
jgi:hypothetical protein